MARPRLTTLLILLACAVSTLLLLWRERASLLPVAAVVSTQEEGEQRYAVLDQRGHEVGGVELERRRELRDGLDGFASRVRASVRLDLLGATRELVVAADTWADDSGDRVEVVGRATSDGTTLELDATVRDGRLVGTLTTGGERLPLDLPVPTDALRPGAFGAPLELPRLAKGQRMSIAGFDPTTLSAGRVELEGLGDTELKLGDEIVAARLISVRQGPIWTRIHVDEGGQLLRAETPFGLILERRAIDAKPAPTQAAAEVVAFAMVQPKPGSLEPRRGAARLVVLVGGERHLPESARQQRREDGSYEILALGPNQAASTSSASTAAPIAATALLLDPLLAPEPLIQSDHPRIVAAAAEIVAGLDDPWPRAVAIGRFVFDELDKVPTASVPSALEVLATKTGDCNEHAVLYTALARAAGLPTRIAIGLAWSEQHHAFAYHAWPEVWIAGHFVALDPTWGEDIADATHLALLHGGLERWLALGGWIGSIEIEVLEVE